MTGYILVVDDEPETTQMIKVMLSTLGIQTRIAYDGEEALSYVREESPVLILLDLMMPRMSGYQVLDYLQQNPSMSHIPVIVLTAYSSQKEKATIPGVVQVMAKGSARATDIRELVSDVLSIATSGNGRLH